MIFVDLSKLRTSTLHASDQEDITPARIFFVIKVIQVKYLQKLNGFSVVCLVTVFVAVVMTVDVVVVGAVVGVIVAVILSVVVGKGEQR